MTVEITGQGVEQAVDAGFNGTSADPHHVALTLAVEVLRQRRELAAAAVVEEERDSLRCSVAQLRLRVREHAARESRLQQDLEQAWLVVGRAEMVAAGMPERFGNVIGRKVGRFIATGQL